MCLRQRSFGKRKPEPATWKRQLLLPLDTRAAVSGVLEVIQLGINHHDHRLISSRNSPGESRRRASEASPAHGFQKKNSISSLDASPGLALQLHARDIGGAPYDDLSLRLGDLPLLPPQLSMDSPHGTASTSTTVADLDGFILTLHPWSQVGSEARNAIPAHLKRRPV